MSWKEGIGAPGNHTPEKVLMPMGLILHIKGLRIEMITQQNVDLKHNLGRQHLVPFSLC